MKEIAEGNRDYRKKKKIEKNNQNQSGPLGDTIGGGLIKKQAPSEQDYGRESTDGKIDRLKNEIFQEFGIEIATIPTKSLLRFPGRNTNTAEPAPKHEVARVLPWLQEILRIYPTEMLRASGIKKVFLINKLKDTKEDLTFGGTAGRLDFVLNISGHDKATFARAFNHELFHILDNRTSGFTDYAWTDLNPNGYADYANRSGYEAIKNGNRIKKTNPGFMRPYGQDGGVHEDKATFAESLLTETELRSAINRCEKDSYVKAKVEMMTGCEFKDGFFTKTYSDSEYKDKFGIEPNFYFLWSRDAQGNIKMDHNWWNERILAISSPRQREQFIENTVAQKENEILQKFGITIKTSTQSTILTFADGKKLNSEPVSIRSLLETLEWLQEILRTSSEKLKAKGVKGIHLVGTLKNPDGVYVYSTHGKTELVLAIEHLSKQHLAEIIKQELFSM